MTTRILPSCEWHRLDGTEAEAVWPRLDPLKASVLVVEHDGAIVATWILMTVVHAECLWIAPEHRKRTSVARHLLRFMRETARRMGVSVVATAAISDDVRALLEHVGAEKVPADHYAMRVH